MTDWFTSLAGGLPVWVGDYMIPAAVGVIAVVLALLVHWIAFRMLKRLVSASENESDNIVLKSVIRPSRYALVVLAIVIAAREIAALETFWEKVGGFLMPALIGWIAIALLHALAKTLELRADISVPDNRSARRRRTRLTIFSRITTFVIIFITVGLMLLSIPGVRDIGVTLMASAGLAALAVGAAAQPALKALIAGFQMALTEPINIGDAVIIGGEWGWIEEIRTTYVVVKVWDERRLVVPTTKFLEEIFQNWTKTTAQLMGTVMLYVDPMAKLDPIREKFYELIEQNERWDRRVKWMQVTDLTRDAVEVRFLMTAKDSPTLFDLRCDIREALIAWIRDTMPEAIVRNRVLPVGPMEVGGLGPVSGEVLAQLGGEGSANG